MKEGKEPRPSERGKATINSYFSCIRRDKHLVELGGNRYTAPLLFSSSLPSAHFPNAIPVIPARPFIHPAVFVLRKNSSRLKDLEERDARAPATR